MEPIRTGQHGIVLFKNRSLRLSKPEVVKPYIREMPARAHFVASMTIQRIRPWLRIDLGIPEVLDATFFPQLASIIKG
jgi:hypothetical protein